MALEYRDGDDVVIQASLPGIDPERDLEVFVSHDVLHIRAGHAEGPEPAAYGSDLRYGTFARDIPLPAGTLEDQVTVTYQGTQLEVRAPFAHRPAQAVPIPVRRPC